MSNVNLPQPGRRNNGAGARRPHRRPGPCLSAQPSPLSHLRLPRAYAKRRPGEGAVFASLGFVARHQPTVNDVDFNVIWEAASRTSAFT
jgi:hypothetical protein